MNSYRYFDYDHSLDGLMTVIFDHYEYIEVMHFRKSEQMNMLDKTTFVETDLIKSQRVIKSLEEKFGKGFIREVLAVFLSINPEKEDVIIRTIKGAYVYGKGYLYSSEKAPSMFRSIRRRVLSENHSYKGLLRFKEVEGDVMLAEFAPENDILTLILPHFIKRLPTIKFLIVDVKRKTCAYYDSKDVQFFDVKELKYQVSEKEEFYEDAFKTFYKAIGIDQRRNEKLMIQNMPKRYWRYLVEK